MVETLTDDQIAQFKEAFSLFDRDGDGKISTAEFGTAIRSLGANPTNAELREMIAEIDTTSLIDFPLFVSLMSIQLQKVRGESDVIAAFRVFDKAESGYVLVDDIRHVLSTLGETLSKEEIDRMIDEADENKTGKIEYVPYAKVLCSQH